MKPFLLTNPIERLCPSRALIHCRNRLFQRAEKITIGKEPNAFSIAFVPAPPAHLDAPVIELSLNGHPAWISASWSDLTRLANGSLEGIPAEDAALLLEEALSASLDAWEAKTGTEIRCKRLSAPPEGDDLILAGVTLEMGERAFLGRLWLSGGACDALATAQTPKPARWETLYGLHVSLKLELPAGTISLDDLRSLEPGDALSLTYEAVSDRLILEGNLSAPATVQEDGTVILNGPFQPRNELNGEPTMADTDDAQTLPKPDKSDDVAVTNVGDIEMRLSFRLGETLMPVNRLRSLAPGAAIPLDRPDGDLVDIIVNGQCIGKGELITVSGQPAIEIRKLFSDG